MPAVSQQRGFGRLWVKLRSLAAMLASANSDTRRCVDMVHAEEFV